MTRQPVTKIPINARATTSVFFFFFTILIKEPKWLDWSEQKNNNNIYIYITNTIKTVMQTVSELN